MAAVTFDTLKVMKHLRDAGIGEPVAEAIVEGLVEISQCRRAISCEDQNPVGFKDELKRFERRITFKLGLVMVVAIGAVAIVLKLIVR